MGAKQSKTEYWAPMRRKKRFEDNFTYSKLDGLWRLRRPQEDTQSLQGVYEGEVTAMGIVHALLTFGVTENQLAAEIGVDLEVIHGAVGWYLDQMTLEESDIARGNWDDHLTLMENLRNLGYLPTSTFDD